MSEKKLFDFGAHLVLLLVPLLLELAVQPVLLAPVLFLQLYLFLAVLKRSVGVRMSGSQGVIVR